MFLLIPLAFATYGEDAEFGDNYSTTASDYIAFDRFNRPDNSNIGNLETGQTWQQEGQGNEVISGGMLYIQDGEAADSRPKFAQSLEAEYTDVFTLDIIMFHPSGTSASHGMKLRRADGFDLSQLMTIWVGGAGDRLRYTDESGGGDHDTTPTFNWVDVTDTTILVRLVVDTSETINMTIFNFSVTDGIITLDTLGILEDVSSGYADDFGFPVIVGDRRNDLWVTEIAIYNGTIRPTKPPIIDTSAPAIKLGVNNSAPKRFETINISFNVTDDIAPTFVNMTINFTTGTIIANYTTTADIDLHNLSNITDIRGNVLNISVCAVDAADNYACNSTKITVANTVPFTPTIILPTLDDYNNTQPNYPFKVTFPADNDGDTITIRYYINGLLNQSTATNTTFNASDAHYVLNVSLTDGIGWSPNATVNFTVDTTIPTLLIFNLTNNTRFGYINATMNITIQDTNPFRLQFNFHNAIIASIYNQSNNELNSSTTLSIVHNLNLTQLDSGNYTLDINFSDRHTNTKIKEYGVYEISEGLIFVTTEGNEVVITQIEGKRGEKTKSTKKTDRHTIEYGITEKRETKRFLVIADTDIYIVDGSGYKGHLIIGNRNWMDFENTDRESEVTIERVGWNTVIVTVYSNDFNFQSIGGLNVVNMFFNFQIDNHAPVTKVEVNHTIPNQNEVINITGNATDIIAVSTVLISHNNSGSWVNATKKTVPNNTTNFVEHSLLLTITAEEGSTIGAMACGNDTFNNFSCSSVLTMQVNDTTLPTVIGGNNATRFLRNASINFTFNTTDNFKLSIGQVLVDDGNFIRIFNTSLNGTSDSFHQNITLGGNAADCMNVTGRVNDSFRNVNQFEQTFCITKDLFVNATNVYDNTTILSFTATLFNDTFSVTNSTTVGVLNFSDIIRGSYNLNISSDEFGGYHNLSFTGINGANDFTARMHQAIVFFTAIIRGTDFDVTDYNLSVPLAVNTSNSSGGLRMLLNASAYQVSGEAGSYFDILQNISVGNQSTNRLVALFYDMNVTIRVFSVANATFLDNFTIELEGNNFEETLVAIGKDNVTFSLGNNTYDISVSHPDFVTTPFSFSVISNSTFPNLTFSLLGLNSINFSLFDEITEELIPQNATINLISDDFIANLSTEDGSLYVQDLLPGEYRITYSSDKYTERDFYVSIVNDTNQSIELYLLSTGNSTDVTFTVQDNSGNELNNATIRLKRYYLSSNSYRTVAMSRTNDEGNTILNVDFNDAFYETLTTFKEFSLRTIGARIISLTRILTLDLIPEPFETIDAIDNMVTSLSFNNVTQTFSYVFTDLGGASRQGTLTVIEITPTTETVLCSSTDTSPSATLLCTVNTTNLTGTFTAQGVVKIGGTNILTNSLTVFTGIVEQLRNVWGTQGIFFTILVAGVLASLGAVVSPAAAIIMFLVGLGITAFFGMSLISVSFLIIFLIIGGIIIFKMKR